MRKLALVAWAVGLFAAAGTALGQDAGAAAANGAAPAPLARYFPLDRTVLYFENQGTANRSEVWNQSEASKLLEGTPTGKMVETMIAQAVDQLTANTPNKKFTGADVSAVIKQAAIHGCALGITGGANIEGAILVVRGVGANRDAMGQFGRVVTSGYPPDQPPNPLQGPGGRQIIAMGPKDTPQLAWWLEGTDLVLVRRKTASVEGAQEVIALLGTTNKSMTEHPSYASLFAPRDGFTPIVAGFMDLVKAGVPDQPGTAEMGLDTLERFECRWGVRDNALVSSIRLVAPGTKEGALALFDQPTFGKADLPPLPAGLTDFFIASAEPAKMFDQVGAIMASGPPQVKQAWDAVAQSFQDRRGVKLKEEFLAQLGPKMVAYVAPGGTSIAPPPDAGGQTNPLTVATGWLINPPRISAVAQVKDVKVFEKALDGAINALNDSLANAAGAMGASGASAESMIGRPAPDFSLNVMVEGGQTKTVTKRDLLGKVVVLDFFATWCPPCREELPELQKMVRNLEKGNKNVAVVVVSQDQEEGRGSVRGLVEKTLNDLGVRLVGSKVASVALDPAQVIGRSYGIDAYPTLVVIDPKGTIRAVHVGYASEVPKKLASEVDRLLGGKALVGEKKAGAATPGLAFKRNTGHDQPTYILNIPAGTLPTALPPTVAPAIVLGKKHVAFGINAKVARDALAIADGDKKEVWEPGSEFGPTIDRLPDTMTMLWVIDPRSRMPEIMQSFPEVAQAIIANIRLQADARNGATLAGAAAPGGARGPQANMGDPRSRLQGASPGGGNSNRLQGAPGGNSNSGLDSAGAAGPGPVGDDFNSGSAYSSGSGSQPPGANQSGGQRAAPGAITFNIPPDQRPNADQVRPHLFPAAWFVSVTPEGIEIVSHQAFPDIGGVTPDMAMIGGIGGGAIAIVRDLMGIAPPPPGGAGAPPAIAPPGPGAAPGLVPAPGPGGGARPGADGDDFGVKGRGRP